MDVIDLTYEQALEHLTSGERIGHPRRNYGMCFARGLLHKALCEGTALDIYPPAEDGTRPAVQIRLQRGTATKPDRYWIRDVTVTPLREADGSPAQRRNVSAV